MLQRRSGRFGEEEEDERQHWDERGFFDRLRDWRREPEWGRQGGDYGVYRGTASDQRESGGAWRADQDWGRYSGASDYGGGREQWMSGAHAGRGPRNDLQGTVNDCWAKRWAEDVAEGIWGVQDVHNQIRVTTTAFGQEGREEQESQQRPGQQQRGPWAA